MEYLNDYSVLTRIHQDSQCKVSYDSKFPNLPHKETLFLLLLLRLIGITRRKQAARWTSKDTFKTSRQTTTQVPQIGAKLNENLVYKDITFKGIVEMTLIFLLKYTMEVFDNLYLLII